jgi:hypothetical protein
MSTGSLTAPDLYFSSSAQTGSDVMFKIEAGALTGSAVAIQIIATGSQTSYAISASQGTIIGTIFSGSVFNGTFTGSHFGTSSWSTTASISLTSSYLTTANSYQITNLTASNISASNNLSASNIWFGNSMTYQESVSTGSLTAPDLYFSSSAQTGSDVLLKLEVGALTGSAVALQIVATGSLTSYAISASQGTIIGTIFSGSVFNGTFTGSNFGTSSWAQSASISLTSSYLTTANSYQITNLTASNISASGTGNFRIVGVGTATPGTIAGLNAQTKLDIVGANTDVAARIFSNTGSGFSALAMGRTTEDASFGVPGSSSAFVADSVAGDFVLKQNNAAQAIRLGAGSGTSSLVVTSTSVLHPLSSVGIGSNSPVTRFDVVTGSLIPAAKFVGLVGVGAAPATTNPGQVYIFGAGEASTTFPFKFDSVAFDTTTVSTGHGFKAWLKVYVTNVTGFVDGTTYYIPVYS